MPSDYHNGQHSSKIPNTHTHTHTFHLISNIYKKLKIIKIMNKTGLYYTSLINSP